MELWPLTEKEFVAFIYKKKEVLSFSLLRFRYFAKIVGGIEKTTTVVLQKYFTFFINSV